MSTTSAKSESRAERSLHCGRCGAAFACGRSDVQGCWCAALPPLPREHYADGADCLCPACLSAALASTPTGPRAA